MKTNKKTIFIKGAREHNLKNISLHIPREKLVVITGLSGSGKSSLAFDTIYAEGQRRYVESLSTYARQFLGNMNKPDVDNIEGLSPAISIEQKTRSKNPRSTVGTITEIYDYLRLLYSRIGKQKCYKCNSNISKQSSQQIFNSILELPEGEKIQIMSPIIMMKKGTHQELLKSFIKEGFLKALINDEIVDLHKNHTLDKNKKHNIDIIIDRLKINKKSHTRLIDSIELALKLGNGLLKLVDSGNKCKIFNENLACSKCNISFQDLEPRFFSFNSPLGACKSCDGLGTMMKIDEERVIEDKNKSIAQGCIAPLGEAPWNNRYKHKMYNLSKEYNFDLKMPWKNLNPQTKKILLYGIKPKIKKQQFKGEKQLQFKGFIPRLDRRYKKTTSSYVREWIEKFMTIQNCSHCKGERLQPAHLSVFINNNNIASLCELSIEDLIKFFKNLKYNKTDKLISKSIVKEIQSRLNFLNNVGLNYLSLHRKATTLSGGESQRIRLATQIGSQLVGVLYILDEPSIGLHARDNNKLIQTLLNLKNLGNTVIVVEHDESMMKAADWIIDLGKGAGIHGGNIIFEGTYKKILKDKKSITGQYLSHQKIITIPKTKRTGNKKELLLVPRVPPRNHQETVTKLQKSLYLIYNHF